MWDVQQPRLNQNPPSLSQWFHQTIQDSTLRLRIRLRGNNLHLLLEGKAAPDSHQILPRLTAALKTDADSFYRFFQQTEDPVYKLILYGRIIGQERPAWIESIMLADLQGSDRPTSAPRPGDTALISNESLARTGAPDAIARYLSESLSHLGVSVKVLVQKLPHLDDPESPDPQTAHRRLWVICSCDYSPDASLIAEPIAQQLRELELEGFREAVIRSQVSGEAAPDWVLQVDLTHPKELLHNWSQWGDEQAINRLLNQQVAADGLHVRAILQDSTLHVFCILHPSENLPTAVPHANQAIKGVSHCLTTIRPQGIKAAAIYGIPQHKLTLLQPHSPLDLAHLQADPAWVNWLPLPASHDPDLAVSPQTLAQQQSPVALTFLLQRLLNPNIEGFLATGGIRVKLCFRGHLLHVMTEAVVCPRQTLVAGMIGPFIRNLQIHGITGVRIYGRRAGQSSPLWSQAVNFEPVTHDGTAESDTVPVSLESPPVTAPTRHGGRWERWRSRLHRAFCLTGMFLPHPDAAWPSTPTRWHGQQSLKAAIVWGVVGLLLTSQVDRWLGQSVPVTADAYPDRETVLSLDTDLASDSHQSAVSSAILAAARAQNPDFNNRLLNEKLALYQERVKESGPPDILIVGSSRAMRGIDPSVLSELLAANPQAPEDLDIFNFGINGATVQVVSLLLQQILTPEQLPKVLLWADGARAFNSGRPDQTFDAIAQSEGYAQIQRGQFPPNATSPDNAPPIRPAVSPRELQQHLSHQYQDLNQWLQDQAGSLSALYSHRDEMGDWLRTHFTEPVALMQQELEANADSDAVFATQEPITADGFLALDLRFNPTTYYRNHPKVSGAYDNDYQDFELQGQQNEAMLRLLRYLDRQHVEVIFVNLPLTQDYLDPIRGEYEAEFIDYMTAIARRTDITFRDLGAQWDTEYDYFSDPSHLNRYGAHQVTLHLVEDAQIPWALKLD